MLNLNITSTDVRSGPACLILCGQNRLSREGLRHILNGGTLAVVGEASSLTEAHSLLISADQVVGVLVYEDHGTIGDELSALTAINLEFPKLAVVVLADNATQDALNNTLAAGARGYLPKDISAEALRMSLDLILLGEPVVPMSGSFRTAPSQLHAVANPALPLRTPLSTRETQILACLEDGLANKKIARDLQMAEATVKVHIKAILRKIQVDNRTQAAIWSMNNRRSSAELTSQSVIC